MTRLLLDTNVAIWLMLGERAAITARAIHALEDDANTLLLSAVTPWEIAIKRSLGKLDVGDDWYDVLDSLDLEPLPVTGRHAMAVESLAWHHRDPFDRLLVAQARLEGAALVTADRRMPAYGVRTLW